MMMMMGRKKKSKSVSMKRCIDWSELLPELLELIASKLKIYIDYVRFRTVCLKWRSSASPNPHHLPTQHPWLLFPYRSDTGTDCSFLDPSTNEFHHLNLTESRGSRCCGSSLGWLVFVEESNPTIRLVNPLTRNVIHLPPVTAFPNVLQLDRSKVGKEYLVQKKSDGGSQFRLSMKDMRDQFIMKLVLSSNPNSLENDYIALVILNDRGDLAFHKKGVEEWSIIEEAGCYYEDVIYYNMSFYALSATGKITICDLSGVSPIVTAFTLSATTCDGLNYLVDSFGELMLVSRKIELLEREFELDDDFQCESIYETSDASVFQCESIYETSDASVFQYNSSNQTWVQMNSIGDQMMFLGKNSSVCLSASSGGCERNCIYFSVEMHKEVVHGLYDCGIYRLKDKLVEPLPSADISSRHLLHSPIWITPNPC